MYDQLNDEEYPIELNKLLKKHLNKEKHNVKNILENYFNKSYSSIKRRYQICYWKTICAMYEEFRLEFALESLKENYCMVVMRELGFRDESNFTKWFKRHKGMNPSEYKRMHE